MTQKAGLPLSFLDVLTCGLCGVLVLFFIVMALYQDDDTQTRQTAKLEEEESPFVILAKADHGTKIWLSDEHGRFQIDSKNWSPHFEEYGSNYALLFCKTPPTPGTKITLQDVAIGDTVDFEVIEDGVRKTWKSNNTEATVVVWPSETDSKR